MEREYFVYDGLEVVKTGRIATKEHDVAGWQGTKKVLETVCEITPVVRPGEMTWKRWVKESELFVINDTYAEQDAGELPVDIKINPVVQDAVEDILDKLRGRQQDNRNDPS